MHLFEATVLKIVHRTDLETEATLSCKELDIIPKIETIFEV